MSAETRWQDDGLFAGAERIDEFNDPEPAPVHDLSEEAGDDGGPRDSNVQSTEDSAAPVPGDGRAAPTREQSVAVVAGSARSGNGTEVTVARERLKRGQTPARPLATWGTRGTLNKVVRTRLGATSAEQSYLEAVTTIRRFTWRGPFHLTVVNKKGVGRTVAALLAGGTLASIRGGGVVITEATDAAGDLTRRAEGSPSRGLFELLTSVGEVTNSGLLDWYTQPQTSHARVIGSVAERPQLNGGGFWAVRDCLDRYYSICVTDTSGNPHSSAFRAAIEGTDALLAPTTSDEGSVLALIDTLSLIRESGPAGEHLVRTCVVVLVHDGRPEDAEQIKVAREALQSFGVAATHDAPYDPHIAGRGELTLDSLSGESKQAWTRIVASVLSTTSALTS